MTEDYDYKVIRTMLEDKLKKVHNIEIHYKWVQGHKDLKPILDKEGKRTLLTKAVKININCNKRASTYRINLDRERIPQNNPIMPTESKVHFASKGQIKVGKLDDQIMLHQHREKLATKLKEKFNLSIATFQRIEWHNHGEAVRKQDRIKYLNIAKSIYGWQTVNENQHSWYQESNPTDKCPTCRKSTET